MRGSKRTNLKATREVKALFERFLKARFIELQIYDYKYTHIYIYICIYIIKFTPLL